ncbi:hypothetical protein HELRODRAFT_180872 [Helobdella robusta]|uniref:MICOS complex subunit MIC13 n=1 Tax=Helobdella robusta TaxID=6412 RepID=T1FGC8_HELRO|nr:hypothetical protein HELRODRAFT_180872 [Helobdella robusta]ESN93555.1 hypothetical protein HELRODRAFT_180872 [Helobdella robusta]
MATLLKNTLKVLIGAGAVYVTLDKGAWEVSSEHGSKFLQEVKKNILPETVEYIEKAPSVKTINHAALNKWNKGVQTVFSFIGSVPETTQECFEKLKDQFK